MTEKVTCRRVKPLLSLMVLLSLALFPGDGLAVKFDMWETGMDINEVASVARTYNLPIARKGHVHSYTKFEPKLVDEQFFKASVLEYRTKIGQFSSKIYLRMSDQPKRLYEIEVGIYGIKNRDEFVKEMVGILTQKYGSYREREEGALRYFEWKPEERARITFRMSAAEASVFYTDLKIKGQPKPRGKKKK